MRDIWNKIKNLRFAVKSSIEIRIREQFRCDVEHFSIRWLSFIVLIDIHWHLNNEVKFDMTKSQEVMAMEEKKIVLIK